MTAPTELDERALEAACAATVLGEDADGKPVHLEPQEAATAIRAYLSALPASEAGWREMPAPSLERVVVAGWHPARQMTRGYWWYHEDCTDDAGKPMDHPEATLWLPLSDLLPAFPSAPDRRPA